MQSPEYLFVYGLLRRDVGGPMQPVLNAAARLVGGASWPGRLYRVAEFPGATPTDGDELVVGELYELGEDAAELLARLDAYEGTPDDYVRVRSAVSCEDREIEAWIYVWKRPTDGLERIESGDFASA
ncbi:MAG: gamma-glutamylcyclotransferase [Acidobacteria bacterium]|nr:gamma-glutamylcyclotransferase [Acidobacteriota bacterium]MDA1234392.1 gamma-glutamylcyclotransferase [Acidobacteriota bacterium]